MIHKETNTVVLSTVHHRERNSLAMLFNSCRNMISMDWTSTGNTPNVGRLDILNMIKGIVKQMTTFAYYKNKSVLLSKNQRHLQYNIEMN